MEVRQLRYFLAVAREENITRAAERLHMAQPSLSKQIMDLERDLGKQLLIRGKRKIVLTEDGILLRKRAEEIVELVEKTEREIRSDSTEIVGEIQIGGGMSETVLRVASEFRQIYPGVRFYFYSGDAVDVSERLDHGTLDFAVMLRPIDNVKYDFLALPDSSEWGILMKKDDPLARQSAVTREEIRRLPLVAHRRAGLQNEIAHWAGTDPEHLQIVATYNVLHGSPVALVEQGMGYFVTTRNLLDPVLDPNVHFLPLEPELSTKTALVWKKHAVFSKAEEKFYEKIKAYERASENE
ncbi:LysR family transcriptional regulator [Brotaphodocola sp.]|uniref:LysR family transcriptional regulator n=1 Tax=Brotaphodocola sp. TaxID=3073577 RepID=UPI003D7D8375